MTTNDLPLFTKPADRDFTTALLAYADALRISHRDAARIIRDAFTDTPFLVTYSVHELALRDAAQSCFIVVTNADLTEYVSYDTHDDVLDELRDRDLLD